MYQGWLKFVMDQVNWSSPVQCIYAYAFKSAIVRVVDLWAISSFLAS